MNYSIRLGFLTSDEKAVTITVPRANPAVTGAQVRSAMERILAANVVTAAVGEPAAVEKADLISTEEFVYDI